MTCKRGVNFKKAQVALLSQRTEILFSKALAGR